MSLANLLSSRLGSSVQKTDAFSGYRFMIRFLPIITLFAAPLAAQQVSQPVYRVNNQGATAPARGGTTQFDPAVQPVAAQGSKPFDLAERPGEHPLVPFIRTAKQSMALMDASIQQYTAVLTKRERVDGQLGDQQQIAVKVRNQPFAIYMRFITPLAGQEVLYPSAQNPGKLVALAGGWKRRLGPFNLDPEGSMAMSGQRYPITKAGIRNLTAELIKTAERETKFAESEVRYSTTAKIDGRPTTMIEITHPVPRSSFINHIARVFFDDEYRIPVGYQAFSWPTAQGGKPVLEKQYFYTQLNVNPGLTPADFDESNPNLFK